VVEVIAEEFGTGMAPVAIVDAEEGALGPVLVLTVLRLNNVQYDRHPVFIIVPYKPLVSISSVCPHNAVPPQTALGGLVVRHDYARTRLEGELARILFLSLYRGCF